MVDQQCPSERKRVGFPDSVPLQKLEVCLLTPLPLGYGLERVEVPADELRQGRRAVLCAHQRSGIFEQDFALFGPTDAAAR
jgi:hypothetical protein